MPTILNSPTPYPEINALLQELLTSVQAVLGSHLVGMYLEGSLAAGDFDQDSDIDFLVVTDEEITSELFSALQAMHDRLNAMDSIWAIQLEGMYLARAALRRHDPANASFPNIERGLGERLKMVHYDESGVIHRWIIREHGIVLLGPPPQTLIDPVSPDDLRQAVSAILPGWGGGLLADPTILQQHRGYQSYVVLSMCRILYTLRHGAVVSKHTATRWAREALDPRWAPLIDSAWFGRQNPGLPASAEDVSGTQDFIRYALEYLA